MWQAEAPSALDGVHLSEMIHCAQFNEQYLGRLALPALFGRRIIRRYCIRFLGVSRFSIRGIEVSAGLNPSDLAAYITGLTFVSACDVTATMTPLTVEVSSVPEPGTWALLSLSLAAIGLAAHRKKADRHSTGTGPLCRAFCLLNPPCKHPSQSRTFSLQSRRTVFSAAALLIKPGELVREICNGLVGDRRSMTAELQNLASACRFPNRSYDRKWPGAPYGQGPGNDPNPSLPALRGRRPEPLESRRAAAPAISRR